MKAINLIPFLLMIFRLIGNRIRKTSVNRILKKLENNIDYRIDVADEMYFTVGKVKTPDFRKVFRTFKDRASYFHTDKFEVKGVFDINLDSFLIFVLCNDYDVTIGHNGNTDLAKFIRLLYFRVNKIEKEKIVEMCTYSSENLNDMNLALDFYLDFEKSHNNFYTYLFDEKNH